MRALRGLALGLLCWRWWALAAVLELLLALPPALLWHDWMKGAIAGRYEPGELFANLSSVFRYDHRAEVAALDASASLWLSFAAVCAMLLGAFFAGGWAELATDGGDGRVLARAGGGARRFFWRYVRVWILTLALLALWSWLLFDKPWKTAVLGWILHLPESNGDRLEALTSEWSAVALRAAQALLYAIGVALLLGWADYARLCIARRDGRSALAGGCRALALLVRSPRRALSPLAAIFLVEVALLAGASFFARGLEGRIGTNEAGLGALSALAALTLVLCGLRCWLRGARYLAAGEYVREVVEDGR